MYTSETTAEIIHDLILINNDRIDGYTRALGNLKDGSDQDLRSLFEDYIQQTTQFNHELNPFAVINGEETTEGKPISGKLHRFWLDLKASLSGHDRKSILEECERGEDASKKAYEKAIQESPDLPIHIVSIIRNHAQKQKAAHDHVRNLRDAAL
ncbi:hypothetical protein SF1_17300 [Sphingobacterium faecium NBRC 15299]|jgi:uncharacterized protein (TIGR02284 family)|uniref:ferritin-like domain-containing protein n=1 Tax=Sphingobacterium faecium TaxID=34087 RepID=UPI000D3C22DB|nr:PA2169 family four-helix-bundle protein [Sphingobacterium faecium]PTX09637.1 uncharacterized protein (TIGR02284 family) [Sphingobacterium faecium]GEM63748.1 hypothetical protein SF1_17300 [Sphingobacterium faecium NBRC 15299]